MIVGLHELKYLDNLAQIKRVASAYGATQIQAGGPRILAAWNAAACTRLPRELRMSAYDDVNIIMRGSLEFPQDYIPVAIELVNGSQNLIHFQHPAKPFYIFGPEDGSIPSAILRRCHHVVQIPTGHCLNVSHAVATVLYDRKCKEQ